MASSLPILATRVGGFPLQVRDGGNGYLIDPGSYEQFVDRVAALAAAPALRFRLAQGARQFSEKFSWRSSADRAAAFYERLCHRA